MPNNHNDEEYQSIFDNATEGIFQSSLEGRFLKVNPAMARIYGYKSPDEMVISITNISKQIHVEEASRKKFLNTLTKNEHVEGFEARNYRKDRSIIWTQTNARVVRDHSGKILYFEGFLTDITTRKEAEQALRESEEQFRIVFKNNPIAMSITTVKEGRFTDANQAYWDLSGFGPDEVIGSTGVELGFTNIEFRRILVAKLQKEKSYKNIPGTLYTRSGNTIDTLEFYEVIQLNGKDHILSMYYDISERVLAQNALQENEDKYRQLFEAESDAIFLIDNDNGKILEANAAASELYKYSKEELLGRKNSDLSGEPEETSKETRKTSIQREQVISIPLRYHKRKDGSIFPVEITGRFFKWRGRSVHIAAIRDITHRLKAEMELRASEERFRLAFLTSPDSININRLEDGLYVDINEGFTAITGYSREDAIGKTSLEIDMWDNPKDRDKLIEGLKKNGFVNNLEAKFRMKNGSVITGLMSAKIMMLDNIPHIVSITREIESLKRTEKTLQRQLIELTILNKIALAASSSKSVDELIQRVTETIGDTLYPDNCGVELLTEAGDLLVPHPSYRGISHEKLRLPMHISHGVTGKVVSTGNPIRLGNVSQETAYIEATDGVQSELCVPIRIQDRVIGVLNIESKKSDAFSENDERLLNTVAGSMAASIEQLRLFETSQRRLKELTTLNAVSLACTDATSVDELIGKITQIIGKVLYPDNFGVLLLSKDGNALNPHPSYRGIKDGKFPKSVPLRQGVSGQVAASGKPMRVANVRNNQKYIEVTSQVRSELCVPIAHGDKIHGVVNAESLSINAFSEEDERLLTTIASTLATAIEKLCLIESEKKRRLEAEILREATAALTSSLEIQPLLDAILDNLSRIVHYASASIAMKKDGKLHIVAGRGFPDNYEAIGKKIKSDGKWTAIGKNRGSLIISDVQNDPEFEQWEGSDYMRGWMGVSMVAHDNVIGYIFIDSHEQDAFTEKDATLVETFANSAAVAIENAQLFKAEQKSRQKAETLREASAALTSSLDLQTLLETILDSFAKVVYYDSASVILAHEDGMEIIAARNLPDNFNYVSKRFSKNEKWQHFLTTRKPLIIPDAKTNLSFDKWSDEVVIRGWMGIPLVSKNQVIGYLSLDSHKVNAYANADTDLIQTFANQAAIAIENAYNFIREQSQKQHNAILLDLMRVVASSQTLAGVLQSTLEHTSKLVSFTSGTIQLLEGNNLHVKATKGVAAKNLHYGKVLPLNDFHLNKKAIKDKTPIYVPDIQKNINYVELNKREVANSLLIVPLIYKNKAIGLISLVSEERAHFTDQDIDLITAVAKHASIVIENARLLEVEQLRYRESETLRQTAEAITSSLDIRQVLSAILNNLSMVIPYNSAALFLIEGDKVRITAGMGFPDEDRVVGSLFPASNTLFQEIWETGKPLILENAQSDPRFERWAAADQVQGWMGVPLVARGQMIGCITIDSYMPGAYNEHDATLAATFAHQAAAAVENARLYDRGEQQIRQLTILRDIDSAISSSFDLRVTLDFIANHAVKELKADASAILLYNPELEALSLYTQTGFSNGHPTYASYIRIGEGLGGQVALNRKLVQLPDLRSSQELKTAILVEKGFKSYFGIPLIGKGLVKGVLEIYSRTEIQPSSDWLNFLRTLAGQAAIAIDNVDLFKNLHRSNLELTLAYDTTLAGWGRALELRDKETQGHTNRVVKLTVELARRMGVSGEDLTLIMRGALLHDIGKMGIPDGILNKPGPLTEDEWDIMRQHPQYAYDLINPIPFLRSAVEIPYGHHERWDGSGYPLGLQGKEIPLAARIFAVVDIYDALLNERVYREAWPEVKVIEYLKNAAGIEIDSAIVEKFLEMIQEDHYKNQAE